MSEPTRYRLHHVQREGYLLGMEMQEHRDGEYVTHSDYAKLEKRVEELEGQKLQAELVLDGAAGDIDRAEADIAALQQRVQELEYAITQWKLEEQGWKERETTLLAERDRLRDALDRIVYAQTRPGVIGEPSLGLAREALRGGDDGA